MSINLYYKNNEVQDSDELAENFDTLTETGVAEFKEERLLTSDDIVEILGEPQSIAFVGSFLLYNYGDIAPITQSDVASSESDTVSSTSSVESLNQIVYVATLIEDQVYSLGEHVNDESQMQVDFPFEEKDLNLLTHTAGVTYPEFRTEMGFNPHSVFYDFAYQLITYTWYSRTDELFTDISYATNFNGQMVSISFTDKKSTEEPISESNDSEENSQINVEQEGSSVVEEDPELEESDASDDSDEILESSTSEDIETSETAE